MRSSVRCAAALLAAVPLGAGAAEAPSGSDAGPACGGEVVVDRLAAVGPGLEFGLASGRRLRLVDLRSEPTPAGGGQPAAERWLAAFVGRDVAATSVDPPDRWGTAPARLSVTEDGVRPVDVAERLVAAGLARVDPGERDSLCRPGLLRLEHAARTRRTGLWQAAGEPLSAHGPDRLREAAGRYVVVEGRISSVGERSARTYLNFGRDFARDFSVVIPRRTWAAMKRDGLSVESLRGRQVRVRGTIEIRRAPWMELVVAAMLEWRTDATDAP